MRRRVVLAALAVVLVAAAGAAAAFVYREPIAPVAAAGPFDPALVARGAALAAVGDCAVCHAGAAPYAGGRAVHTPFGDVYASNITPDRDTGIGTWSPAAFERSMREGVDREGHYLYPAFPYTHYTHVAAPDLQAIYAFLMTRKPVRAQAPPTRLPFPLDIRPLMAGWNLLFLRGGPVPTDPARSPDWNRGAYLVEGLGHCGACHTPRNALGAEKREAALSGGEADGWDAPGLTASSSPAAVAWTADALYTFLRSGIDDDHAASAGPMHAVSHNLSAVPDADVRAMAVYLASLTDPAGTGPADRAQVLAARAAQAEPAASGHPAGAAIFAGACAACHGAGAPMMLEGRPSLALGSSVSAASPRNAANTVLFGLQPGPGQRGPFMPGFAATLTDTQVADVLGFLRARFTDRPAWTGLPDRVRDFRGDGT